MLIYVLRFVSASVWDLFLPFQIVWLDGLPGMDGATVGLIVGTSIITNRIGGLVLTGLISRYDKRTIVLASQAAAIGTAGGMAVLALTGTRSAAAWLAVSAAFGLANSAATLAQITFIALRFSPEESRKAFSYENVALNLAASVGPLLSGVLVVHAARYYPVAPMVIAVAALALAVRMPGDGPSGHRPTLEAAAGGAGRGIGLVLAMNFLTFVAYAQFYDLFPAYAKDGLGAERVGALFMAGSVLIVLLQVPATRLSTRLGERSQILLPNLVMASGVALLPVARNALPAALCAVFLITAAEMVWGPFYQVLALRAFAGRTTLAMSAITFTWGLAEAGATVLGLMLIDAGAGRLSIVIGAAACVAAAATALGVRRYLPREDAGQEIRPREEATASGTSRGRPRRESL